MKNNEISYHYTIKDSFFVFIPIEYARTHPRGLVLRKGENDHPPSRLRREVRI